MSQLFLCSVWLCTHLLGCPLGLRIICFIREWSDPYQKIGFGDGRKPYKKHMVLRNYRHFPYENIWFLIIRINNLIVFLLRKGSNVKLTSLTEWRALKRGPGSYVFKNRSRLLPAYTRIFNTTRACPPSLWKNRVWGGSESLWKNRVWGHDDGFPYEIIRFWELY